jgi:kinesin family protein C1
MAFWAEDRAATLNDADAALARLQKEMALGTAEKTANGPPTLEIPPPTLTSRTQQLANTPTSRETMKAMSTKERRRRRRSSGNKENMEKTIASIGQAQMAAQLAAALTPRSASVKRKEGRSAAKTPSQIRIRKKPLSPFVQVFEPTGARPAHMSLDCDKDELGWQGCADVPESAVNGREKKLQNGDEAHAAELACMEKKHKQDLKSILAKKDEEHMEAMQAAVRKAISSKEAQHMASLQSSLRTKEAQLKKAVEAKEAEKVQLLAAKEAEYAAAIQTLQGGKESIAEEAHAALVEAMARTKAEEIESVLAAKEAEHAVAMQAVVKEKEAENKGTFKVAVAEMREEHAKAIQAVLESKVQEHSTAMEAEAVKQDAEKDALLAVKEAEHTARVKALVTEHMRKEKEHNEALKAAVEAKEAEKEQEKEQFLAVKEAEHDQALASFLDDHEEVLRVMQEEHQAALATKVVEHEQRAQDLQTAADKALAAAESSYTNKARELEARTTELEATLRESQGAHGEIKVVVETELQKVQQGLLLEQQAKDAMTAELERAKVEIEEAAAALATERQEVARVKAELAVSATKVEQAALRAEETKEQAEAKAKVQISETHTTIVELKRELANEGQIRKAAQAECMSQRNRGAKLQEETVRLKNEQVLSTVLLKKECQKASTASIECEQLKQECESLKKEGELFVRLKEASDEQREQMKEQLEQQEEETKQISEQLKQQKQRFKKKLQEEQRKSDDEVNAQSSLLQLAAEEYAQHCTMLQQQYDQKTKLCSELQHQHKHKTEESIQMSTQMQAQYTKLKERCGQLEEHCTKLQHEGNELRAENGAVKKEKETVVEELREEKEVLVEQAEVQAELSRQLGEVERETTLWREEALEVRTGLEQQLADLQARVVAANARASDAEAKATVQAGDAKENAAEAEEMAKEMESAIARAEELAAMAAVAETRADEATVRADDEAMKADAALDRAAAMEEQAAASEGIRRLLHNKVMELKGNVRVFCRVRPLPSGVSSASSPSTLTFPDGEAGQRALQISTTQSNKPKQFSFDFDRVFGPSTAQSEVYREVSALVQSVVDGYKVCIFAYGQTGSGKTHTMMGSVGSTARSSTHRSTTRSTTRSTPLSSTASSSLVHADQSEGDTVGDTVPSSGDDQAGVIPRSIAQLFASTEALHTSGWTFNIDIEIVEIYNESLRDLLVGVESVNDDVGVGDECSRPCAGNGADGESSVINIPRAQPQRIVKTRANKGESMVPPSRSACKSRVQTNQQPKVRANKSTGMGECVGLNRLRVSSLSQVLSALAHANEVRADTGSVKKTKMNETSSRSHTVVMLKITGQRTRDDDGVEIREGSLNLIDLAGSERLSKAGTGGDPTMLAETKAINKSLSALGHVMTSLHANSQFSNTTTSRQTHVPYRDSTLTHLLQSSLALGDSKTLMFCNVSSEPLNANESLCSLRFAQTANACRLGGGR